MTRETRTLHFDTRAVHAGAEVDRETGAVAPPLHLSTTFEHAPDGTSQAGFNYQRGGSPTQARLEAALASLDGADDALFCGSGIAAGTAMLQALPVGSHVLMQDDLYHGMRTLARDFASRWSLSASSVDMTDLDAVHSAMRSDTCLLWAESPSNPLLKVVDIEALAACAHAAGARLLVDGTFATPALQQPLALGADVVLHSATKFMGGHSDVMGGVLAFARHDELAIASRAATASLGLNASPFAAWMVLRGLRSLPVRMQRHCENALAIAGFLETHAAVSTVHYPGLASHPQHAIAARQMRAFGGVLSIRVRGGREAALAAAGRMQLFINATSLGGCESLIEHRASIEGAHAVTVDDLLRISVGLEDAADLIDDLDRALRA